MTTSKHESEHRLPIDALEAGIEFLTSQPVSTETDPTIIESLKELGLYQEPTSTDEISYVTEVMESLLPKVEVISGYINGQESPTQELTAQKDRYSRVIDATKMLIAISKEVVVDQVDLVPATTTEISTITTPLALRESNVETKTNTTKLLISKRAQRKVERIITDVSDRESRAELLKLIKEDIDLVRAKQSRQAELTANEVKALAVRDVTDKAFKHIVNLSDDGVFTITQVVDVIFDQETRKEFKKMRYVKEFIANHIFDRSKYFSTKSNVAIKVGETETKHGADTNPRSTFLYRISDDYAEFLGVEQKYKSEIVENVSAKKKVIKPSEIINQFTDNSEDIVNAQGTGESINHVNEGSEVVQEVLDLESFLVDVLYDQLEQFRLIKMPATGMHSINSYFDQIIKPQKSVEGLDGTIINIQKSRLIALTKASFETVKVLSELAKINDQVLELDKSFTEVIASKMFDTSKDEKGFEFMTEFTFVFLSNMLKNSEYFKVETDRDNYLMLVEQISADEIVIPKEPVVPVSHKGTPLFGDEVTSRLQQFIADIPTESRRFAR